MPADSLKAAFFLQWYKQALGRTKNACLDTAKTEKRVKDARAY